MQHLYQKGLLLPVKTIITIAKMGKEKREAILLLMPAILNREKVLIFQVLKEITH